MGGYERCHSHEWEKKNVTETFSHGHHPSLREGRMKAKLFSGSLLHAKEVRGLHWLSQQKEFVPGPMSFLKGEKVKMKTEL